MGCFDLWKIWGKTLFYMNNLASFLFQRQVLTSTQIRAFLTINTLSTRQYHFVNPLVVQQSMPKEMGGDYYLSEYQEC